jgi:hypothetical protein
MMTYFLCTHKMKKGKKVQMLLSTLLNQIFLMKKNLFCLSLLLFIFFLGILPYAYGDNQTSTVSPVLPSTSLPYQIRIEQDNFSLPNGLQSFAYATHEDKWLLLAGRTNGLHNFNEDTNNFPPNKQNTTVYVVDPKNQRVYSKPLDDPYSGLTQHQIDTLSVTSPQFYQWEKTLYITGGYGVDTATGLFSTKATLTAINVPKLMHWVIHSKPHSTAAEHIRQISDPIFQVTGGYMTRVNQDLWLLVFGQNFMGYYLPSSNGAYTEQVRCFQIQDNGIDLHAFPKPSESPKPAYRRRDLNVVPIIQQAGYEEESSYVALSGVFTISGGAWTVPVNVYEDGTTFMADPNDPNTFKQAMNNYASPTFGAFSKNTGSMYITIFGGISFGYFQNNVFLTDSELPFINQITTIQMDAAGQFTQYLMDNEYPVIPNAVNGNPLLFGAGAQFIPVDTLSTYENGVVKLDEIHAFKSFIGYIVGGIQSKLPNTNTSADSAASPYIFKVYLTKNET